jgi:hypothetical protein
MKASILAWNAILPSRELICHLPAFGTRAGMMRVCVPCEDPRRAEEIPWALGRKIDRFSALAISAAAPLVEALPRDCDLTRVGIFIGNMLGGWAYGEPQLKNLIELGPSAVHPYQATAWFPAAAQGELCLHYQIQGTSKTVSGGWLCGVEALMVASDALAMQTIDFAIAGAAESPVSSFGLWGLSRNEQEKTFGEGAALVLLERGTGKKPSISIDSCGFDFNSPPDSDEFTSGSSAPIDIEAEIAIPGVSPLIIIMKLISQVGGDNGIETVRFQGSGRSYEVTISKANVV